MSAGGLKQSAALAHLAIPERGVLVHFDCSATVPVQIDNGFWGEKHKLSRHYGWTLTAAAALERWGPDATLDDLERRAVCSICGARRPKVSVSIHVPTSPVADASQGRTLNWG
jgi:hypothetical protein